MTQLVSLIYTNSTNLFLKRIVTCFLLLAFVIPPALYAGTGTNDPTTNLPATFRKNEGQWDGKILYQSFSNGSCISFLKNELSYAFRRPAGNKLPAPDAGPQEDQSESMVWNLAFIGANEQSVIKAEKPSKTCVNYFRGQSHVTHVSDYSAVTYEDIYKGIDLRYYSTGTSLKYDYLVKSGSPVSQIRMGCKGIHKIQLDEEGNLNITTAWGTLMEKRPYSYQIIGDKKIICDIVYAVLNDSTYGFKIKGGVKAGYDLVIDPVILQWSTFVGGPSPGGGYLYDIALDAAGNVYGCGYYNNGFPTTPGTYSPAYHVAGSCGFAGGDEDAYVWKMNPNGTALLWATYIGGSCRERARGIAVDAAGNVYVTGWTESTNFPTQNAFQPAIAGYFDVFATKLNPTGTALIYSTYIGGLANDWGEKVAVNAAGEAYYCGSAQDPGSNPGFPTTPGSVQPAWGGGSYQSDAFVTKLNAAGNALVYSTYLGGTGWDWAYSIRLNTADEAFVTGTAQTNFPTTPGCYQPACAGYGDVFVSRLNATGSAFIYSTLIGGTTSSEVGNSIVINASDEAYITGRTTSSDYPATPGAYDVTYNGGTYGDVIVSHLNASGSSLLASTYLGSPTLDIGWGIDLDANMNVFVAGYTDNAAFPTTLCAYDRTYNGTNDADYFIAKFDPALKKLMYSTYVGGNDQDYWEPKIKLKGTPCNQMAVCSGTSHSTNFPTTAGSFESTKLNGVDDQPTVYMLSPKIKGGFTITPNPVCGGATALLHDTTSDCGLWGDTLTIHHWDFGDGTTGNGVTAVHAYPSNGTYTVTLIVGCPMDTVKKVVTISSGFNLTTSSTSPGCSASSGSITATPSGGPGPFVYSWSNGATTQTVSGLPAGSYTVTVTGAGGCTQTDTVTLNSTGGPTLALAAQNDPLCNGGNNGSATIQASGGTVPYSFSWSPSGGTSATATGLHGGTYTCTVKDANGCIQTQTVTLNEPTAITVSSTSVNTNCGTATGSASVAATGGTGTLSYSWTPTGGTTANATNLSAGNYTCTITDANGCSQQTSVAVNSTGGPTITIASQSDPLCHGGSNGNATISASGGTSPYTYSWFPSGGTSATASGLASGTYTCTVTDASSCVHTQTVIITQPVVITDSTNITNASCGTNNGTALVDADGGTGTLTYSWSSPSGVTGPIASGLGAGTYTCVVSDANGCTLTQTVTLTQSPALVVTATAASGCGSRGGSAAATVTGGSGSYTYSWSPTGGTSSTANGLGTGTYTCTVNDAAGCLKTTIVAVTTDSIPMAGAGSNVTIHYGDSIVLNASGGGTYSWYPYTDLSCSACQRPSAHPSATTEYCVLVTNAKGCKDSSCVTVSIDYDCGEVYVPNFFSPNGDGKNDRLCIYGNCIQTLQFRIYDRWGEQVFETKNALVCWDGTFRGQNMNSAVFVYYLQAVLINGQTVTQKGNITLLR